MLPVATLGSIDLSVKSINGIQMCVVEHTPTPITTDSVSPQSHVTISSLTSGQQYVFRMAGVGADPTRVYSDAVSSFVL